MKTMEMAKPLLCKLDDTFKNYFQQVTTKVPPAYDGRSSWFAYEDAIDDWVDITELEPEKQGPALRNRLEGEAAIHKRLLDREKLKDKVNGVQYFKSYLRPLFVKGASNVFLYRFQQFMTLHRGSGDMLRWITRFQLSRARMQEAWDDTYVPITDVNNPEARAYVSTLTQEEQNTITPEDALAAANARMEDEEGLSAGMSRWSQQRILDRSPCGTEDF